MAGDLLNRMARMVRGVLSDDDILSGAGLTDGAFHKIAARLGVSPDEARLLFQSLTTRLRQKQAQIEEAEAAFGAPAAQRFTVEPDAMGNATVRDSQTGKSVLLRGNDASEAVDAAGDKQNGQERLSRFAPLMEDEAEHWKALDRTGFYGAQGAGCIVLARDTGRLLLGLRSQGCEQPGTWNGFGGAIDSGEDPAEAVRREVVEELGYHGSLKLIPLYVFRKGTFRYSNFLAIVDHEFHPRLNWEHDDAEWFEWGDWPHPLHFGISAVLNDPKSVAIIEDEIAKAHGNNHVMESAKPLMEDDFHSEISHTPLGTFNFPWAINHMHGLATARFSGHGADMDVTVLSVRDDAGRKVTDVDLDAIADQARAYIGQE
jgi:8-oxo-dGTP pyrophosphatase MutT (NUDIX family)